MIEEYFLKCNIVFIKKGKVQNMELVFRHALAVFLAFFFFFFLFFFFVCVRIDFSHLVQLCFLLNFFRKCFFKITHAVLHASTIRSGELKRNDGFLFNVVVILFTYT